MKKKQILSNGILLFIALILIISSYVKLYDDVKKQSTTKEIKTNAINENITLYSLENEKTHSNNDASVDKETYSVEDLSSSENESNFVYDDILFEITYYSAYDGENPDIAMPTASGVWPQYGYVASNVYAFDTEIKLDGIGTFIVKDTGGNEFDNFYRLDIFIPQNIGEDKESYEKRVLSMGRHLVLGHVKRYI